ncbi:hypothetical protein LTR22_025033 [Elasticomyces elasticus]|nr:hypothetical protein LTR22_025033 [Elasticomyces elasticus]
MTKQLADAAKLPVVWVHSDSTAHDKYQWLNKQLLSTIDNAVLQTWAALVRDDNGSDTFFLETFRAYLAFAAAVGSYLRDDDDLLEACAQRTQDEMVWEPSCKKMESIQGDATIEGYRGQCQALYKRVQSYGKLFSGRHESTETRPYALEGKNVVQHVWELFIPAKMSKEGADRDFTPDQWDEVLADLNNFATDGDAQESWYTEWKIGIPGCTALNLERKEFGITRPKWEDQERKQQKVKQESPKEKSKREKRESKNHKAVEKSDVARDDGGAGGDTPGVNTRRGEKVEVVTEQIFCYVRDTPIKSQFAERLKDAFNRLVARIPPEIDGTPATLTAAIQDFE